MLLGVDHFVIAVGDLAAAMRDYATLGFSVVPGGRHAAGTHNALIALAAGAYIELIAFHEPYAEHRWWTALGRGGGLVDYCLQTNDLAAHTGAFRRAGVAMTDPKPSVRTRPDGYAVKWVLALAEGPQRGAAPFLIRDEGPRAERVPIGQWVDSRGPGPYAARFTGGPPGAALDPRLTHGARLSFV